jgi:3-keto-disaccharide hydrolase
MKKRIGFWLLVPVAVAFLVAPALSGSESATESCDGFVSLFDGKTLDGWKRCRENGEIVPPKDSAFHVEDGVIHCTGKGQDYWLVIPGEKYGDCILRLEFKLVKDTNSGVFLRAPGLDLPAYKGFEVQVYDDWDINPKTNKLERFEPNKHSSGSVFDVLSPMRNMSRPLGEWEQMEITSKGSVFTVTHNGFKIIDADFATLTEPIGKFDFPYSEMPKEGYIGVQNHGHELWFRNIEVKRLD